MANKRLPPKELFSIDPIHEELNIHGPDASPIILDIWKQKYQNPIGNEDTPAHTHRRIVEGVYKHDKSRKAKAAAHEAVAKLLWLPGGRIQQTAGTDKHTTMINCFVSQTIEDSMGPIADAIKDAMLTMQQGGGIGMDFSTLRPTGAYLNKTQAIASGPLPFMDMWDSMCATIKSAGGRRGAMMATISDEHPDLPAFINAKREKGRLTNFNVSVLISDAFMDAVLLDEIWHLGFTEPREDKTHIFEMQQDDGQTWYAYSEWKARDLWNLILENTYEWSEPGVIFIDRVNATNNLNYLENIRCTNPCGEQPLPPYGCCNLGAVNLARLVRDPFTDQATFDFPLLRSIVNVGVRFLDNVIDTTIYPLEQQRAEEINKRRLGLGITGLANCLSQLGLVYGSYVGNEMIVQIMSELANCAYSASADLAKERGAFPLYTEHWGQTDLVKNLDRKVLTKIRKHGIRNGVLLTIAPTGTTSLFAGNISSGLEPVFLHRATRTVKTPAGKKNYPTIDYGFALYCLHNKLDPLQVNLDMLPDYMVAHDKLEVAQHLQVQATCQNWIDASISKTINCPEDMEYESFKGIYQTAYDSGCKGCTTYRPSDVRGSILSAEGNDKGESDKPKVSLIVRPDQLNGTTYKVKWPHDTEAYFVTINSVEGQPFEMFISSTSSKYTDWTTALSLMISAIMRRGEDISFLPKELMKVVSATETGFVDKKFYGSLVALIGATIDRHIRGNSEISASEPSAKPSGNAGMMIGYQAPTYVSEMSIGKSVAPKDTFTAQMSTCPECNAPAIIHMEGCERCTNCSYSQCS